MAAITKLRSLKARSGRTAGRQPPSATVATSWPRVRIRVDFSERCAVGPGKVALLEAIARVGSLSLAARELGMSYRRAWDLLADLNRSFESPLATTTVGGMQGGGARLTTQGRKLIREFRTLELATRRIAARQMRAFRERGA